MKLELEKQFAVSNSSVPNNIFDCVPPEETVWEVAGYALNAGPLSTAIVTPVDPLYDVPVKPVPIVNAAKLEPKEIPEIVELVNAELPIFDKVFEEPLIVLLVKTSEDVSVTTVFSKEIVIVSPDIVVSTPEPPAIFNVSPKEIVEAV